MLDDTEKARRIAAQLYIQKITDAKTFEEFQAAATALDASHIEARAIETDYQYYRHERESICNQEIELEHQRTRDRIKACYDRAIAQMSATK